ncbi:MAG: efflux RND transporter periplasmic adaptor subunit [Nitrospirota bacterium]
MRKKGVIITIIIIILSIGGVIWWYYSKKDSAEKSYRTSKVERGELTSSVSASGTLNAIVTVLVGSQVSGTIQSLYADFNSVVKKWQVIARLDPSTFSAQVNQAKANLVNAEANLEKAKVAVADTKRNLERAKELSAKGIISQSDLDTAQTNYDSAVAQVNSAVAQVEQAKAALNLAEVNLSYTVIKAPVNGIVISRNVDVGQTVAASLQAPTLFTIAQDLTKMQIDTNVDEADIGKVKDEMDVEFTVDSYPEKVFEGKVIQVRNAPIVVQNVVTYDVVVGVDNPDLRLKPGMTANVSIIIARKDNVLKVPNAALRFRPPKGSSSPEKKESSDKRDKKDRAWQKVWMLEKGKLKAIPVRIGISNGSFSEILEGDIKEGQEVVVEGVLGVKMKPSPAAGHPPGGVPRMFR